MLSLDLQLSYHKLMTINTYLQQHFKHHTGFDATEIIKAGSLGHGTVVPGEFDIDLVLYSRGTYIRI